MGRGRIRGLALGHLPRAQRECDDDPSSRIDLRRCLQTEKHTACPLSKPALPDHLLTELVELLGPSKRESGTDLCPAGCGHPAPRAGVYAQTCFLFVSE